jgi:hypothetical protein
MKCAVHMNKQNLPDEMRLIAQADVDIEILEAIVESLEIPANQVLKYANERPTYIVIFAEEPELQKGLFTLLTMFMETIPLAEMQDKVMTGTLDEHGFL